MNIEEMGFNGLATALNGNPDAILLLGGEELYAMSMPSCAVGKTAITAARLQYLVDRGIKKIVLALDDERLTKQVIETAYELIVPPEMLVAMSEWEYPDVDAHRWLALSFINQYEDKEELVRAVIRLDEAIISPVRIAHMALHFFPVIEEHLGPLEEPIGELYLAYRHQVTQKKSNDAIRNAAKVATEMTAQGQHEAAKATLFAGYRESEALLRMSKLKPVRTLNERLDEHEAHILKYRNRDILGLRTDMEVLTDALMGLRGLILLGGGPNLGKTILATQLAIQALRHHPDCCVVYLNLDMDTTDLITRIRCHMGSVEWKAFTRGDTIGIHVGRSSVEAIGGRLVILDQENFTGDEEEVSYIISELKKQSGCSRVLIVVDYLQVLEVPEKIRPALRSELDVDEWKVAQVKRLKGMIQKHDAVLVVSEVRKEAYNRELGMEDLKGSSRLSYAADVVLLLQSPTVDEFCMHFRADSGQLAWSWPHKKEIEDMKEPEKKKNAAAVRDRLQLDSLAVAYLQIAKGRDGTVRKRIPITAYFKTATIVEGFYIDGPPEKDIQGEGDELKAIFAEDVDHGAMQGDDNAAKDQGWIR